MVDDAHFEGVAGFRSRVIRLPEPDAEGSALLDWWMPVAESGVVSTRLLELALPLRRLRERGD